MIITRSSVLKLIFSISASASSSSTPSHHAAAAVAQPQPHQDPLLLRAARGESVEHTPVWMMRQAGRHMKSYRDLVEQYPTFRQRSETPGVSKEISLQPFRAYGVDGVILFSDILTPLPAMGVDFDISEGGKISIKPIRNRKDFSKMKRIDVETACSFVGKVLSELRKEVDNDATVLGFVGLPFTLASYVVEGKTGLATKFAEIKEMAQEDPQLLHNILTLLAGNIAEYACYQGDQQQQLRSLRLTSFRSCGGHFIHDFSKAHVCRSCIDRMRAGAHRDCCLIKHLKRNKDKQLFTKNKMKYGHYVIISLVSLITSGSANPVVSIDETHRGLRRYSYNKLCIFSNVANGVRGQCDSIDDGHAALLLVPKSGIYRTYGLWPDSHPDIEKNGLSNGSGSDVRKNFYLDKWTRSSYPYIYCEIISTSELGDFLMLVEEKWKWRYTNNCASFATEVFYEVTGTDVDADDWNFMGNDTPCELGESIIRLNND